MPTYSCGLNMDNIQYDSLHIPQLGKACVGKINMRVYVCVWVGGCVCVFVCVCVWGWVSVCVCVCVCVHVHVVCNGESSAAGSVEGHLVGICGC